MAKYPSYCDHKIIGKIHPKCQPATSPAPFPWGGDKGAEQQQDERPQPQQQGEPDQRYQQDQHHAPDQRKQQVLREEQVLREQHEAYVHKSEGGAPLQP